MQTRNLARVLIALVETAHLIVGLSAEGFLVRGLASTTFCSGGGEGYSLGPIFTSSSPSSGAWPLGGAGRVLLLVLSMGVGSVLGELAGLRSQRCREGDLSNGFVGGETGASRGGLPKSLGDFGCSGCDRGGVVTQLLERLGGMPW